MKTTLSMILGIVTGAAIGLLIAPAPGNVTRKKIREEADRMLSGRMQNIKPKVVRFTEKLVEATA